MSQDQAETIPLGWWKVNAMTTLGYARVSTGDQQAGLAAQERDLLAAGADRIISEQISSVARRPGLEECLSALREGDVLIVTKPDRLARSTGHLLSIVEDLTQRNIGLIVLSMGGEKLDTRNPTSKLVLTIMGGVAAWEREIMLERQREGIARAKAEGKFKGRQPIAQADRVRKLYHELGADGAAKELGINRSSVYRIVAKEAA